MKYLAAYALLALGGNNSPSEGDLKNLLKEVGAEVDDAQLKKVVDALKGKNLQEVIAEGMTKVASLSFGGGSGSGGSAPTQAVQSAPVAKKEEKPAKKEEPVEEEEVDIGAGGLFGDDF